MVFQDSIFRADRSNGHRGGGVLLLVRDNMGAVEVKMNSTFSDQVWCRSSSVFDVY